MKPFFSDNDCDLFLDGFGPVMSVKDANAKFDEWLSKGKVVECKIMDDGSGYWGKRCVDKTHKAILINLEPIEEGEKNRVLREAADYLERNYPLMNHPEDEKYRADIAYRARKLLERGGE